MNGLDGLKAEQADVKSFKDTSIIYGILAILPFCLVLFMSLLYPHPLFYFIICPIGAISLVVIAFAEVRLIWKYFDGKVSKRKLSTICFILLLFGLFTAFIFIIITYLGLIINNHSDPAAQPQLNYLSSPHFSDFIIFLPFYAWIFSAA
jgi:hypothetical protein